MEKYAILVVIMKKLRFGIASAPPKLTTPKWWMLPTALAVVNAGMALGQLASFEEFVGIIESYGLVEGQAATTVALSIAAVEILTLPVLLRLQLSPAMRAASSVSVILAPVVWLQLSGWASWLLYSGFQLQNNGYFGSFIQQPFGWWVVLEGIVLLAASLFALKVLGGDRLLGR